MDSRSSIRLVVVAVAASVAGSLQLVLAAADRFVDVPDSNVFHDDISWLADAGVTRGCNPPDNTNFCPGDDVTREQMAVFMRRLAEGRVVDAGTVGGNSADHLKTTVTGFIGSEAVLVPNQFEALLGEVELSVADGRYTAVTTQALGTQSLSGRSGGPGFKLTTVSAKRPSRRCQVRASRRLRTRETSSTSLLTAAS